MKGSKRCTRCRGMKRDQQCWISPSDPRCVRCLSAKQKCSLADFSKRRRTGTISGSRRPTRGKCICKLRLLLTNNFVIEEAQALVDTDRNVDEEATREVEAQLRGRKPSLPALIDARDTVNWRLESSAHELDLILKERVTDRQVLAGLERTIERLEAEEAAEGSGEGTDEGEDEIQSDGDDEEVEDALGA
jgi:hypothetical protein